MADRAEGTGPGAAVVAADQNGIGVRLGHSGGNDADSRLRHQLHVDAGAAVGILQVEDELCQVFDTVDVVVGWRTDQAHPGGGIAHPTDPFVDLVAG